MEGRIKIEGLFKRGFFSGCCKDLFSPVVGENLSQSSHQFGFLSIFVSTSHFLGSV